MGCLVPPRANLSRCCCEMHFFLSAQVKKALDEIQKRYGAQVNAVVQCAGIAIATKMISKKGVHPLDAFAKVMNINTIGTFNVMRLAAERMASSSASGAAAGAAIPEAGVIINTARCVSFWRNQGDAHSVRAIVVLAFAIYPTFFTLFPAHTHAALPLSRARLARRPTAPPRAPLWA